MSLTILNSPARNVVRSTSAKLLIPSVSVPVAQLYLLLRSYASTATRTSAERTGTGTFFLRAMSTDMSTAASKLAPAPDSQSASAAAPSASSKISEKKVEEDGPPKPTGLVMQIIVRRDLLTVHKWPVGPLLAQSAHAATAVLHRFRDHPDVRRYLEGEDGRGWECMRKVVLEVPDEQTLKDVAQKVDGMANPIPYHLWIEQPENTPTALALIPNKRPKALKKILDEHCVLFS
ncbi:hypothetical protein I317_03149 [Kwoniella heveanensis CBS 569]|nr:hypothetical protein I317_03149 [Kwoniella heveanensis CBS 569]